MKVMKNSSLPQNRGFKIGKDTKIVRGRGNSANSAGQITNCISYDNRKRKNKMKNLLRNLLKYTIGLPFLLIISIFFFALGILGTILELFLASIGFIVGEEFEFGAEGIRFLEMGIDLWRPIR